MNSADSRVRGFVPRQNIVGCPLFNYWSFVTQEDSDNHAGALQTIAWGCHILLHFFSDTRWARTFKPIR
jgi:signal peptidase I